MGGGVEDAMAAGRREVRQSVLRLEPTGLLAGPRRDDDEWPVAEARVRVRLLEGIGQGADLVASAACGRRRRLVGRQPEDGPRRPMRANEGDSVEAIR